MPRPIPQIDKDIDANHAELQRRAGKLRADFIAWGNAWAANPDLQTREHELFRERGVAQLERDQRDYDRAMGAARKTKRAERPKKCPTCGATTLYAT